MGITNQGGKVRLIPTPRRTVTALVPATSPHPTDQAKESRSHPRSLPLAVVPLPLNQARELWF